MLKRVYFLVVPIFFMLATGCASSLQKTSQLRKVSLGMSKVDVVARIGEPTVVRGSIKNKFDQIIEVWEYTLALPSQDSIGRVVSKTVITVATFGLFASVWHPKMKNYWFYFLNRKLVQWGEAGDWKNEPKRIYEFNFNPSPSLRK